MDTPPTPLRSAAVPSMGRWRAVRALGAAGVLAAACLASGGAWADEDPSGRVARVAEVSGDVRTVSPEGAWVPLPRNQPLSTGDRVITDKDGRATIEVGSSTVRVGAYSDVSFQRLDDQKIFLHFDHGQLAVRVRSADILGELTIVTDEGVWVPHHPGYYRFDRVPNGLLAGQSWSGDLLLEAPDSSLPVAAGQRAEVWREGAQQATHYRMVPLPVDAFSDWALVQDRLDDRDAAKSPTPPSVPPEMSGGSDLGRYGQWSRSPDYGDVWTPNGLPAGWAPYQDGSWSWIAPWGWTWIDASAWGFAPFHYGRWVQLRGRWCWTPGHWTGRPVYAPALVGWLGGPGLAVGGKPAVGWVPLAPNEPFFPGYASTARYWSAVNDGRTPPAAHGLDPAKGRPRFVPSGAADYANRGVPGAVTVVSQSAMLPHVPVSTMPALPKADRKRALGAGANDLAPLPPPAPPTGHGALPGSQTIVQVPTAAVVAGKGVATPAATATPRAKAVPEPASQVVNDRRPAIAPPLAAPPTIAPPVAPSFKPTPPRAVGAAPAPVQGVVAAPLPVAPVAPARAGAAAAPTTSRGEGDRAAGDSRERR